MASPAGDPQGEILAVFRVSQGPRIGDELPVTHRQTTVGSAAANTLALDDDTVSRSHARLDFEHGAWQLTDLGSTNGTWVEGTRLAAQVPTPLPFGATVQFGQTRLHFRAAERAAAPTAGHTPAETTVFAPTVGASAGAGVPQGSVDAEPRPTMTPARPAAPAQPAPHTPSSPLPAAGGLLRAPGWIVALVVLLLAVLGLVFLRDRGVLDGGAADPAVQTESAEPTAPPGTTGARSVPMTVRAA